MVRRDQRLDDRVDHAGEDALAVDLIGIAHDRKLACRQFKVRSHQPAACDDRSGGGLVGAARAGDEHRCVAGGERSSVAVGGGVPEACSPPAGHGSKVGDCGDIVFDQNLARHPDPLLPEDAGDAAFIV
jgi:hypothetical protein